MISGVTNTCLCQFQDSITLLCGEADQELDAHIAWLAGPSCPRLANALLSQSFGTDHVLGSLSVWVT